jgi:hypothetical protein
MQGCNPQAIPVPTKQDKPGSKTFRAFFTRAAIVYKSTTGSKIKIALLVHEKKSITYFPP